MTMTEEQCSFLRQTIAHHREIGYLGAFTAGGVEDLLDTIDAIRATLSRVEAERDGLRVELEDLRHAVRFLAKREASTFAIRGSAIQMLAKGEIEEAKDLVMMKWPIVQGLRNQMDLATIGNQECDYKRVRPAIEKMLTPTEGEKP